MQQPPASPQVLQVLLHRFAIELLRLCRKRNVKRLTDCHNFENLLVPVCGLSFVCHSAAPPAQQQKAEEPAGNELDGLQERFEALKRR